MLGAVFGKYEWKAPKARRASAGLVFVAAVCTLVFSTWLGFRLHLGLATAGFLYLVPVVLAAGYGGFWMATGASLLAVGCLDFFFTAPLFTLEVTSPFDWMALGAFEFTALVVSRLSHIANRKRAEADAERSNSERLYEISRRVLLLDKSRHPGPLLTSLLLKAFELNAVVLFDAEPPEIYSSGNSSAEQEARVRDAYFRDTEEFDEGISTWVCILRSDGRAIGSLALSGRAISPLLARSLASLCAIAMERSRSLERQYRAEAARDSERLRTAVLDALAHDFKTPVATILAASRVF